MGPLAKYLLLHIVAALVDSLGVALVAVVEPKKKAYADIYGNYDSRQGFEEM
jgi:hypothetical protein